MAAEYRVPKGTGDGIENIAEREQAIWGNLYGAHLQPDSEGWDELSPGQKMVVATVELDYQVFSGGLTHYFSRHHSDWDHAVREGLMLLGASEHVEVFDRARRAFPGGEPPNNDFDADVLLFDDEPEGLCAALSECTVALYALRNGPKNLTPLASRTSTLTPTSSFFPEAVEHRTFLTPNTSALHARP